MNRNSSLKPFAPLLLFLAALGAASTVRAAPANDDYTAAEVLLGGPVYETSNTDATLEANEPLPPGFTAETYQGSLWWKWTPIFTGWYEINTEGSAIDTVLSIWTGSGPDLSTPKYMVHANDEADIGRVSRIRLYADNNTDYRIAVAGRGPAERGAVCVHAAYMMDPFAKVVAAEFVHSSVDVTSASASVTATLTIEASREIDSGTLNIFTPGGVLQTSVPLSGANRINGFVARGDYQVVFSLPRYLAPGSYRWSVHMAHPSLNKFASQGAEAMTPLPYGMISSVAVSNSGMVDAFHQWRSACLANGMNSTCLTLDRFAFGVSAGQAIPPTMAASGGALVRTGLPNICMVNEAGGSRRLCVQFVRRLTAAQEGLRYTVQFSSNLIDWEDATEPGQPLGSSSTHEAVQVSDSAVVPGTPRRFARVLVENLLTP